MTDWRLEGVDFGACNCSWGCPCQFNSLPSNGHCVGGITIKVERGYFGATRLDGVAWGLLCEWPGAMHEGNGRILVYVDGRAAPEQREAIVEIAAGRHSQEGTLFHILAAVCPTRVPPVFEPLDFEYDNGARTARVRVRGFLDIAAEPIRNPVTGDLHFPRLVLPNGFEFKEAEFASATISATGPIELATRQSHAHFARVHLGPQGYVE